MSHVTKVETQLKDVVMLKKALLSLGYTFSEASAGVKREVKAWEDQTIEADLEIKLEGPYGIAVNRTEKGLEIAADWWAVETYAGRKQEQILSEINKQYAYETVMDKMSAGGYSLVQEEQEEKENIHLVVRRWV